MKLKEFNTENVTHTRKGTPTLSVNCKGGLFTFSKDSVELIGMKANDQIIFCQDEDDKGNWYLEIVKEKGFSVREKGNVTTGLFFNNCHLARTLSGTPEGSHKFLIAGKPTIEKKRILWGLISSPNKT